MPAQPPTLPGTAVQLGSLHPQLVQPQPALPAQTCALWGNKGKNAHFDFFLHLELYFLQCTSPPLPFGPVKGLRAGRQPLWVSAAG